MLVNKMVVSNQQTAQQDDEQVYDVIFVVEKTASLEPYLEELKTNYLLPTLEFFNGGPPSAIDTGHDYNCTLYCLVTYTAGDSAPEMASDCTYPTTSTHELIQSFDKLQFIGGAGQSCSHVSEGLSTALQCLDEIKQLRYSGKPTERHCILICNSPPYHIVAEESQDYRGYNSEQLASMMGKRGVHLSIISPRKLLSLQKLYNEACAGDNYHNSQPGHYAVDPRHLVLLKGYQLQERSLSPKLEEDKKPGMGGLAQSSVHQVPQPPQPAPMGMSQQQQVVGPQQGCAPTMCNLSAGLDPITGHTQPMAGPAGCNQNHMQAVRVQGPQGKGLVGMSGGPGNVMQTRMRQPDPNMMHPGMQGAQGMMAIQTPSSVAISAAGSMLNPQLSQPGVTNSQANMLGPQVNSAMMSAMVGQVPTQSNPALMQVGTPGMGGMQQAQPNQQQQQPPPNAPFGQQPGYPVTAADQSTSALMQPIGQGQLPQVPGQRERRVVWSGTMEYQDRNVQSPIHANGNFLLNCNVSIDIQDSDISTVDWPQKLTIQLLPQRMLTTLQQLCKNSRQVFFNFNNTNTDALKNFYVLMGNGFAGCVKFPYHLDTKIILVMYSAKKKSFIGLIPHDQVGIVQGIKKVIQQHRAKAPGGAPAAAMSGMGTSGMQVPVASSQGAIMQGQVPMQVNSTQQQVAAQQQQQPPQQGQSQPGQAGRQANLSLQNDLQLAQKREMQFQQQQPPGGVDQKKVVMVQQTQQQQQQQQAQQQQIMAHRAKLQQQQQQHLQAQRLQMHQQQSLANPQLRHMLMNQHQQQQMRQQQLLMQQQHQLRGGAPQGQPSAAMGPGAQQAMQAASIGQMAQQNYMEDFNLPEII